MVQLTSSTQWTIPLMNCMSPAMPLSGSTIATTTIKPGSLLGLKTCHFTGPPLNQQDSHYLTASSADQREQLRSSSFGSITDLHSSSSRRLQAIVTDTKGRSAGSFRLEDSFPDWSKEECGGPFHAEEKFNVIPWSTSDPANVAHILEAQGDITSADVDLLPMPGLVGFSPTLYQPCFSLSPSSSCESISTPKSCQEMPNHLGLPPHYTRAKDAQAGNLLEYSVGCLRGMDVANDHVTGIKKGSAAGEQESFQYSMGLATRAFPPFHDIAAGSSSISKVVASHGEYEDNFADCLAGLWSHSRTGCDRDQMLNDSESLASILTDVSPKRNVSSSSALASAPHPPICSPFIMNELDYVMMSSKEVSDSSKTTHNHFERVVSASSCVEKSDKGVWEMEPHAAMTNSNSQAQVNSTEVSKVKNEAVCIIENDGSYESKAASSSKTSSEEGIFNPPPSAETGLNASFLVPKHDQSMCTLPSSVRRMRDDRDGCSIIGRKRPFSAFQRHASGTTSSLMSGANKWSSQPNLGDIMHQSQLQKDAFSAMLYKYQGGLGLQGNHGLSMHIGDITETSKPPPPKTRRRHGTAMDPQSIAARTRRERFSDRIRILQSLVPNGERLDTVSMLGQTLEYVRFLQHQVWQLYHGLDPASPNNIKCEKWKDFLEAERPATS